MILSLDIETMADAARIAALPEPKAKKNLVDPAKIKADIAEKKAKQVENAAKYPISGRIICIGIHGDAPGMHHSSCVGTSDDDERSLLQGLFDNYLNDPEIRLVTFNGNHFDLPFIYRRAIMLGVSPKHFGAPPLSIWTKKFGNDRHVDMMTVWAGSDHIADADSLADVAQAILGETRAEEEYEKFPELMQTEEGRKHIADACLHHTELTYRIYERALGTLF